jgi:hypothetical protein
LKLGAGPAGLEHDPMEVAASLVEKRLAEKYPKKEEMVHVS